MSFISNPMNNSIENMQNLLLSKKYIINEFIDKQIIKYGNFTLKSGEVSNYYADLKSLVNYPKMVNRIMNDIYQELINYNLCEEEGGSSYDFTDYVICGIPYGGIYFASLLSSISNIPLILLRNDVKNHGTKQQIEGNYTGKKVILIEDVITTGTSIIESLKILHSHNIEVSYIFVLLNREKGGFINVMDYFKKNNIHTPIKYNSYLYISNIMKNIGSNSMSNSMNNSMSNSMSNNMKKDISFSNLENKWTNKLNNVISTKNTNICLSLDVPNWTKFFDILEKVKHKICILKIHLDIMEHVDNETFNNNINILLRISKVNKFMIWEDRKFCDIGSTNKMQLDKLIEYGIDFVSVNPSGGFKSVEPFFDKIGIFILAEMSCKDNFMNDTYTYNCLKLVNNYYDKISGVINQNICKKLIHEDVLSITPGVSITNSGDNMGQQHRSIENLKHHPDILVIGRAIYNSENPCDIIDDILDRQRKI